jgi:UDP-glucose 4-epimerase
MKILITGGAGYLGTELVYRLAQATDAEITVYDNLSRGNFNLFIGNQAVGGKVKFIQADILDTRTLVKAVQNADVVYHLAATVTTPFSDQTPHLFEQTNNWGTAELCYALEEKGNGKLIYLSSVSVYGSGDEEVDVDSPINPRTFYGISKMRGEEHVHRLMNKMPVYILRCGNVYGYSKSMRFDAVINRFMFDAHFHGRITLNGTGEQNRSFIHVDKAVDVLEGIYHNKLKPGRYDLVERILSVNDIAFTLKEIYPEMEMLYVNQHMKLRQIRVKPNPSVNKLFSNPDCNLQSDLEKFRERFTF